MKKQFLSLLLLFVFVLGLGTPAAAYEDNDSCGLAIATAEDLERLEDLELVELGGGSVPVDSDWNFEVEPMLLDDTEATTRARTPDLYITDMYINPVIYAKDINGNDGLIVLAKVGRYTTYGASAGYQQFGGMSLTFAQFQELLNDTFEYASQEPQLNGMQILFAGWRVGGHYKYAAQKPLYFEYEGDGACIDSENPKRDYLSSSSPNPFDVSRVFTVPGGNYEGRYLEVVRGGFYFMSDGNQLSAGLGLTLVVNSDRN